MGAKVRIPSIDKIPNAFEVEDGKIDATHTDLSIDTGPSKPVYYFNNIIASGPAPTSHCEEPCDVDTDDHMVEAFSNDKGRRLLRFARNDNN